MVYRTELGVAVPAVTAEEMREVDRVAVDEFGLQVLQMMENAGRSLAMHAVDMLSGSDGSVVVLAGAGGNGGGGLCCARHLLNRGVAVDVLLDREPSLLSGAAAAQYHVLHEAGVRAAATEGAQGVLARTSVAVDALIGYGLSGPARGRVEELIDLVNTRDGTVLSLDVPSGVNATTGEAAGVVTRPDRTLTLALPKTGLAGVPGELFVADIGIPPEVFSRVGTVVTPFFGGDYWVRVRAEGRG